jgi:lysophospholipase L1-like esterase
LLVACAGVMAVAAAGFAQALPSGSVTDLAVAGELASRDPHDVIEYDVFGDSISAGFGVPAHRTWVAGVSYHLFVTKPADEEHHFYNHAIAGQAIATPSFLATDQGNSSLLIHLRNFVQSPPRPTPLAERTVVLTPSVNELIVSDQGTSGRDRVAKAVYGVRAAIGVLRDAGVPSSNIIVLPMPPIGLQFAAEYEATSEIDQTLASMIVDVNAGLTDVLDVRWYPSLDGNNNGLAVDQFYDGLYDTASRRGADGLHLDADGHAALAADVDDYFRDR